MPNKLPRGLYVITDEQLTPAEHLVDRVAQAIQGGAVMVQYRDKSPGHERRLWEAQDLQNLCRSLSVPLIINDDIQLAAEVQAAGVHLGKDDAAIHEARKMLGDGAIIGVSCYNQLEFAIQAEQAGADYVAFGSFYPSSVKPAAVRADLHLLEEARQRLNIPVVAIGGITADNGAPLVEAGADLLAVISDVFAQRDISAAARAIQQLYS